MKIIAGLHRLKRATTPTVVTIGNYDGVHRGHQILLAALTATAKAQKASATVVIFEPTPLEIMRPDEAPHRITSLRDKLERLEVAGIDQVVILNFRQVADIAPEEFVKTVLVDGLQTSVIRVGDDFRFGKNRAGDFDTLTKLGAEHGFSAERLEPVRVNGTRASSTLIRHALSTGGLDRAQKLLGRRYKVTGKVAHGDKLGRQLNFRTANLEFRFPLALNGVYLVQVKLLDRGETKFGVANAGTRPTVYGNSHRLEVHLLDFSGDLYGERLSVAVLKYIRGERAFASFRALKEQIARDVVAAKTFFKIDSEN